MKGNAYPFTMWSPAAQWPSLVFCVLIACCPIHLIPQRLTRLNKRETKRSANEMLIYWQSLRNVEVMQTQILLFLHYWYHARANPYTQPLQRILLCMRWPSLSSSKSWSINKPMLLNPQGWSFYFIITVARWRKTEWTRMKSGKLFYFSD